MLESRQVMAYLRVSTKRQADEGNSLETQRSQALEYAAMNGLKLVESNIVKEEKTATKKITEDFFSEDTLKERLSFTD